MANPTIATGSKTSPPDGNPTFPSEIKSTPNVVGTAVISENMHTMGTNVKYFRSWAKQDVQDYMPCEVDAMMQELIYRCRYEPNSNSEPESVSEQEKKTLLKEALEDVLHLCDNTMKKTMKKHFSEFINYPTEPPSYKPFVQAVNYALGRLAQLDARGIVPSRIAAGAPTPQYMGYVKGKGRNVQPICSTSVPDAGPSQRASNERRVYELRSSVRANKRTSDHSDQPTSNKRLKGNNGNPNNEKLKIRDKGRVYELRSSIRANKRSSDNSDQPTSNKRLKGKNGNPNNGRPKAAGPAGGVCGLRSSIRANKRTSDHSDQPTSNKRLKGDNGGPNNEKPKATDPMAQNGMFAAKTPAADVAQRHVISCLVNNGMLNIRYFDWQNAIQCSGLNFIHDLPRFLVLLLIMQRLPYARWGHNRLFELPPGVLGKIAVEDEKLGTVNLQLHLDSPEHVTHYGLRGRATNVFRVRSKILSQEARKRPSLNKTGEPVAKLYWPKQSQHSEAKILKEMHKIAAKKAGVKGHVPDVIWSHKFEGTSTAKIRKALGIEDSQGGNRVLYIIAFRKLRPITELSGDEFLRAWWNAVVCHRILWAHGVRHRDISLCNLKFYLDSDKRVIGVLNDYDLSSRKKHVPTSQGRMGTMPFMAMELLTSKALKGKVEHIYRHDAESFVWVLTFASLRYEDGKLLNEGRLLDNWLTVGANRCHKAKSTFLSLERMNDNLRVSPSHRTNWNVARSCLHRVALFIALYPSPRPVVDGYEVFRDWLEAQVPPSVRE